MSEQILLGTSQKLNEYDNIHRNHPHPIRLPLLNQHPLPYLRIIDDWDDKLNWWAQINQKALDSAEPLVCWMGFNFPVSLAIHVEQVYFRGFKWSSWNLKFKFLSTRKPGTITIFSPSLLLFPVRKLDLEKRVSFLSGHSKFNRKPFGQAWDIQIISSGRHKITFAVSTTAQQFHLLHLPIVVISCGYLTIGYSRSRSFTMVNLRHLSRIHVIMFTSSAIYHMPWFSKHSP